MAAAHAAALDAEMHAAVQSKLQVAGSGVCHPIVAVEKGPLHRCSAVVEDRLAFQLDLDLAVDALHRADEHVVGAIVGRRAGRRRDAVRPDTRTHGERVAHHYPSSSGVPRRDQRVGSRFVGAGVGDGDAEGAEAKAAGLAVEQRAEYAG